MAIIDITVVPVGTNTTSVSNYVASVHKLLADYKSKGVLTYELTPMSTIIEGELSDLFQVVQHIHESIFDKDVKRITTNIRIDDRRDKQSSMQSKLESVKSKL
ncbi:MTH1187 family thiamine-binding protein [Bacillus sp. HMF5848]|uniref:MTH1187 family thiamine-binding protein n=1 Tax=Bacillus sp. HMF5848 TaxID=2495421 RepID=UPI000F794BDF|nr:MTH1187 family thiamine-binding protein [Bacillus sp. HMF5848]RSK27837.1 MTH1187 family thiamine-binding protein [Bacillus sp. HMF5848]